MKSFKISCDGCEIMSEVVNLNGINLWYETFGNKQNSAIIFIAGAMAPATFWDNEFCENLSKHHFVIRFDNRDFGYSTHFDETTPPPYTIYDMVEDTKCLLDYLKIEKAHIAGHSLGGSIAQLFAIKYSDMILTLTPISSPIIANGSLKFLKTSAKILNDMWTVLMANPCHQDFESGLDGFLPSYRFLNGKKEFDLDMATAYVRRIYDTETIIKPHLNHTNIQNNLEDIYEKLSALTVPITFIYGSEDYLAASPINTKILANSLNNSKYIELKDVGHMFLNRNIWKEIYLILTDTLK